MNFQNTSLYFRLDLGSADTPNYSESFGKARIAISFLFVALLLICTSVDAKENSAKKSSATDSPVKERPVKNRKDEFEVEHFDSLNRHSDVNEISPVRKVTHKVERTKTYSKERLRKSKLKGYRSIDGAGNNIDNPSYGAAHIRLVRLMAPDYTDDISSMSGIERPSARHISNVVVASSVDQENSLAASDFLWQWGQFIDHDLDLTEGADPAESAPIAVPLDDEHFLPASEIPFNRSIYDSETGHDSKLPRQQINEITAWIDASNVYGSSEERALALRTLDGTGRLKTSAGDYLPWNSDGLPNATGGRPPEVLVLAGDVRANEQVGLTAMHTLFVREHNRLAKRLKRRNRSWSGEKIYQKARQLVGAQLQAITFREFLPALLGDLAPQKYQGYRKTANPNISNIFSTAAYRFGHSALSPTLLRLDRQGNEIEYGNLALRDAFFSPERLVDEGGLEPIFRGLASQACQKIDVHLVEDVRSFLFGHPAAGGFDLAALNIQRGRDHGLPSYNAVRKAIGLKKLSSFSQVSSDVAVQERLARAYSSVDDIDLWVGGLAEDAIANSHLGVTFSTIIAEQFSALRDGDRYWYQRTLSAREKRFVRRSTLATIIRRNTNIGRGELSRNVFKVNANVE